MKKVELLFDTIRSPYDIAHIIQVANAIDCVIYTAGKKNSIPFDIPKVVSKVKSWNITGEVTEIHDDTFEEAITDLRSKGKYLIGYFWKYQQNLLLIWICQMIKTLLWFSAQKLQA